MTHEAGLKAAHSAYWDYSNDLEGDMDMGKAIKAYLDASGMVLVPREPTETMVHAFDESLPQYVVNYILNEDEINGYKAMLSAAPDPFKSKP